MLPGRADIVYSGWTHRTSHHQPGLGDVIHATVDTTTLQHTCCWVVLYHTCGMSYRMWCNLMRYCLVHVSMHVGSHTESTAGVLIQSATSTVLSVY